MYSIKKTIEQFLMFLCHLYQNRYMIMQFTLRDFKARYLGSYLGLMWAFIQPMITIIIFWFVFEVGFKSAPIENCPFILWLITGMIPWFFIADTVSNATVSIINNSYLVKKVVFRVSLLPIVKMISGLIIHLFFVFIIFILFIFNMEISIYAIQIFYYIFAMSFLLISISWFTSAMIIFLKDIEQIVAIFLQFGFWLTPIFWAIEFVPEKYHVYIKINPFYYIIQGYRDSFIYNTWFWEHNIYGAYFWICTIFLFITGATVFSRLRPHFADVL